MGEAMDIVIPIAIIIALLLIVIKYYRVLNAIRQDIREHLKDRRGKRE